MILARTRWLLTASSQGEPLPIPPSNILKKVLLRLEELQGPDDLDQSDGRREQTERRFARILAARSRFLGFYRNLEVLSSSSLAFEILTACSDSLAELSRVRVLLRTLVVQAKVLEHLDQMQQTTVIVGTPPKRRNRVV